MTSKKFSVRTSIAAAAAAMLLLVGGPAVRAQGFDWYGKPQTQVFINACKPVMDQKRSRGFRYCDTIWNVFKEGYFAGLDVGGKACFIDGAQLSDLVRYIEEKGEEYVRETGWLFAMRDFVGHRLEVCQEERSRLPRN